MNNILFNLVILLANIIQGITGFAGTILAMPSGIMLVGINVAKPILNILGIYAGLYIFFTQRKFVNWKEVGKVVVIMFCGIIAGILLKDYIGSKEDILYKLLGLFVIGLASIGLIKLRNQPKEEEQKTQSTIKNYILLISAGIVHSIFVSGGPLLIGYLTKAVKEKEEFRPTISTIWIVLNTIILIDDIQNGLWTMPVIKMQFVTIPFLLCGMVIGTKIYKYMSQQLFMKVTYILLFVSGISLLIKK